MPKMGKFSLLNKIIDVNSFDSVAVIVYGGECIISNFPARKTSKEAAGASHKIMASRTPGSPYLIVVDDESDIVDVMRMSLKRSGFRVDAFYEPLEALHQFRSDKYDLALIDVKMPIMDGFTLYKHLRAIDPQLKVCFMTALSEAGIIRERLSDLPRVCIAKKPISTEELILLLRAELDSMNQDVGNVNSHPSSDHIAKES